MPKFLTLCLLALFFSCQSESQTSLQRIELLTPSEKIIHAKVAITPTEQEQGLSGVKPSEFDDDEGMLFYYPEDGNKYFWMPDTYFDLDLFYLDKDLKIIDIIRKLPHHIGRHNEHLIPKARGVWSRHTLEMKASSPIARDLKVGDQLTVKGPEGLKRVEEKLKATKLN